MVCAKHHVDRRRRTTFYTIYLDTELNCKSLLEMAVIPSCELKVLQCNVLHVFNVPVCASPILTITNIQNRFNKKVV